jgi:hypothetical protein
MARGILEAARQRAWRQRQLNGSPPRQERLRRRLNVAEPAQGAPEAAATMASSTALLDAVMGRPAQARGEDGVRLLQPCLQNLATDEVGEEFARAAESVENSELETLVTVDPEVQNLVPVFGVAPPVGSQPPPRDVNPPI